MRVFLLVLSYLVISVLAAKSIRVIAQLDDDENFTAGLTGLCWPILFVVIAVIIPIEFIGRLSRKLR